MLTCTARISPPNSRRYGEPDWSSRPLYQEFPEDGSLPNAGAGTYVGDYPKYTEQSYEEWKTERLIQSGLIDLQDDSRSLAFSNSLVVLQGSKSMIEIVIGDGAEVWCLHEAILAAGSTFFKAAMNSPFKEGSERKVTLPEEDNLAFQLFVQYLYTRTFHTNATGLLLKAYVLGDKLGAPNFKALALDKIFDIQRQCCRFTAKQVPWLVENTLPGCGLQRLTIDTIVAHGTWRKILKYGKEDWERLAPIMPELMERIIAIGGAQEGEEKGIIKSRLAYQD